MAKIEHLKKPFRIRNIELKNRFVLGPHQGQFGFSDGLPPEKLRDYLVARAKGGVGLIIVEGGIIMPNSLREPTVLRAYIPEMVPAWTQIVRDLHQHGVKVFSQILHSGRQASSFSNPDMPLWAPSPLPCPLFREIPKEMEIEDIKTLINAYRDCAKNVLACGFDGVEIHACHGYLVHEFLSPDTNRRMDQYGGTLENRMRLLLEIVNSVHAEVGGKIAIGVRLSSQDMVPGGLSLDESPLIAKALEGTGKIDYISVSQGVAQTNEFVRAPMFIPEGYAIEGTSQIKSAVSLPVLAVGRMPNPDTAEKCVRENKADAVVLVRELIADPEYPAKAMAGLEAEIRRCVATLDCVQSVGAGKPVSCLYNAELGREGQNRLKRVEKEKRVLIIGAGPAGLEVARVSALKGHQVTVIERGSEIGGMLHLAAQVESRKELQNVMSFYESQISKLGIQLKLNTFATAENVIKENADVVIVATGAMPLMPPSPLLSKFDIEVGAKMYSYLDVFKMKWSANQKVVLYDGEFDALAMGTADRLVEAGVKVVLVTPSEKPAQKLSSSVQRMWLRSLCSKGMDLVAFRSFIGANAKEAIFKNVHSGQIERIPCEAIVFAQLRKANNDLYLELKERGLNVKAAGDCVAPRSARFAVHDGFEVATQI